MAHFDDAIVAAARDGKILGIRAGAEPHRFTGVWVVVVEDRIFVRSWTRKPDGWFQTLLRDPRAVIQLGGREFDVRAIHTRSDRIKDAVSDAYAAKYNTKASQKYVRGFRAAGRRDATIEFVPLR